MIFLGIDPGVSGGIAIMEECRARVNVIPFAHKEPKEIAQLIKNLRGAKAFLERVHSMPAQGVRSVFTFGMNFGWWQGVLDTCEIPYELVTPQKWQLVMGCRTGGNKNISKARAQELFPNKKVTHATADALLIAEYGRRKEGLHDGVFRKEGLYEE